MKNTILLSLLLCFGQLCAQTVPLQPLKIGSKVPDLALENMIGYHKEKEQLSTFKGKFIVLDFWYSSCKTCLKAFPKLEDLQQKFKDKLVIMPVSFLQTKEQIVAFLEKRKKSGHPVTMPTAVFPSRANDWYRLFPSESFPLLVWINQHGILEALTGDADLTEENLRAWINGNQPSVTLKHFSTSFNSAMPLLLNGNGGPDTAFTYRSVFTRYIDSISSYGLEVHKTATQSRLFMANASLAEMVKECLGWRADIHNKKLVWEVRDRDKFYYPNSKPPLEWKRQNLYCYDLVLPGSFSKEQALAFMLADVCRVFRIHAAIENQTVKCWALQWNGNKKLVSKNKPPFYSSSEDGNNFIIRNKPLAFLLNVLNRKTYPLIINETGCIDNIDLELNLPASFEPGYISGQLKTKGLKLVEAEREMPVLVIRSAN
jgi:thiol-disulfide isomerase/thioredoxin